MKPKKVVAALQERPWLWKSVNQLTGSHPSLINKEHWGPRASAKWNQFVQKWAVRNISEVICRRFEDLNLNDRSRVYYAPHLSGERIDRPNGFHLRYFRPFVRTQYHVFTHLTYECTSWTKPFSQCNTEGIEESWSGKLVRDILKDLSRPHYLAHETIENPRAFDAMVRITQVGILQHCSTTIIDYYLFPENFDTKSL